VKKQLDALTKLADVQQRTLLTMARAFSSSLPALSSQMQGLLDSVLRLEKSSSPAVQGTPAVPFDVTFEGSFGRMSCPAKDVNVDGELLYLIYEAEANHFVPPENQELVVTVQQKDENTEFRCTSPGLTHRLRIEGRRLLCLVLRQL